MAGKAVVVSLTPEMIEKLSEEAERYGSSKATIITKALQEHFDKGILRGSWEVESATDWWYDVTKFYTAASDEHGHSSQVTAQLPKNLIGQLKRVVSDGRIEELRTIGDFVRDAVVHRVHQVAKWIDDGELLNELHVGILFDQQMAIKQARIDAEKYIALFAENLQRGVESGEIEWVRQQITEGSDHAAVLSERYQQELEKVLEGFRVWLAEADKQRRQAIKDGMRVIGEEQ